MRVIIDNNVIISAALIENSVAHQAFAKAVKASAMTLLRSEPTLTELLKTIYKPKFDHYFKPPYSREELIISFINASLNIEIKHKVTACRDSKDNKFLELALSGKANCIITGDQDLLVLHPFETIPIVSPSDFLNMF